jgi:hypothetical protein
VKIVCTDNFARETVADRLVAENIANVEECRVMVDALQKTCISGGPHWYVMKPDSYVLSRGMEDFV